MIDSNVCASSGYTLLTGATGLLGRYLLRDLILAGIPVCVLVRGSRHVSAQSRIESILAACEQTLGRNLARPVVLAGSLDQDGLGLSQEDLRWVAAHVERVLHSAASLKFEPDDEGEPERTNLFGTQRLLALMQSVGIAELHHVSTAYVAGLRTGSIGEDDLDAGQQFGNPYEQSKFAAEKFVRAQSHLRSLTIYRPSIIVGDSETGYTSTFHGFYTPLRLGHAICPKLPRTDVSDFDFLGLLGLEGGERKNLVPVDWVAGAIVDIVADHPLHGATYHLTSSEPTPVVRMVQAFWDVLLPLIGQNVQEISLSDLEQWQASFYDQMRVYQAYWRDDPWFARDRVERALPKRPFPLLTDDRLRRLAQYAVDRNFGWPREPVFTADDQWAKRLHSSSTSAGDCASVREPVRSVGLQLTGRGGGDWTCTVQGQQLREVNRGLASDTDCTLYTTTSLLDQLSRGLVTAQDALARGAVITTGTVLSAGSVIPTGTGIPAGLAMSAGTGATAAQLNDVATLSEVLTAIAGGVGGAVDRTVAAVPT